MRIRTQLLTLTIGIAAVLGLAMASSATADGGATKDASITVDTMSVIQGWDNIGWQHDMIVQLTAGRCDDSGDVDYAMVTLGNNDNKLASIQLNPNSNCALIVYDGENFTGDSVVMPVGSGGCANLGSCFGHNLWNRVQSLKLI